VARPGRPGGRPGGGLRRPLDARQAPNGRPTGRAYDCPG
jgi:hypothetical protein